MIDALKPNKLQPKFFHSPDGTLNISITVEKETISRPLPSMATLEEAQECIDKLVPEMAKELYQRRSNRRKRQRKIE